LGRIKLKLFCERRLKMSDINYGNNELDYASELYNNGSEYYYKQDMEHKIDNTLFENMGDRANDINAQCIDKGKVVLSGFVDVLGDKEEAEYVVNAIEGIDEIENNITIAMGKVHSNKELEQQIATNIQNSIYSTHLMNVSSKVEGGVAVLEGTVENAEYRDHALRLAKDVFNIENVVSRIKLKNNTKH
jgi:osmotically-inducible protein OsmY